MKNATILVPKVVNDPMSISLSRTYLKKRPALMFTVNTVLQCFNSYILTYTTGSTDHLTTSLINTLQHGHALRLRRHQV